MYCEERVEKVENFIDGHTAYFIGFQLNLCKGLFSGVFAISQALVLYV